MDVKSGLSLWHALGGAEHRYPPLAGSESCDVVVVGAGVGGALISWFLIEAGRNVIVVDSCQPGAASTGVSTGLLQYETDSSLSELVSRFGEDKGVRAYRRGLEAIDTLESLCRAMPAQSGFSRRNSLYFATKADDLKDLRKEYLLRHDFGFEVEYLDRGALERISSIPAEGAIYSFNDGQMNPLRFTRELIARSAAHGVKVYGDTEVQKVTSRKNEVMVETANGTIVAREVVYATGYDSRPFLSGNFGKLHSTYAASSLPVSTLEGWPVGSLLWETARPYFYARQNDDGRILIGGGDTPWEDDHQTRGLLEKKTQDLISRFRELFPAIPFELEYQWAGTFGESKDGLAYIGREKKNSHEYFCLGYGGNGITFAVIAAQLIRDLIMGEPNDDRELFKFDR